MHAEAHARKVYERLLSEQEVAQLLNVHPRTLTMWRYTRRVILPHVKVGRLVRYKLEDVQRFIDARTLNSTTDAKKAA